MSWSPQDASPGDSTPWLSQFLCFSCEADWSMCSAGVLVDSGQWGFDIGTTGLKFGIVYVLISFPNFLDNTQTWQTCIVSVPQRVHSATVVVCVMWCRLYSVYYVPAAYHRLLCSPWGPRCVFYICVLFLMINSSVIHHWWLAPCQDEVADHMLADWCAHTFVNLCDWKVGSHFLTWWLGTFVRSFFKETEFIRLKVKNVLHVSVPPCWIPPSLSRFTAQFVFTLSFPLSRLWLIITVGSPLVFSFHCYIIIHCTLIPTFASVTFSPIPFHPQCNVLSPPLYPLS